MISRPAKPTNHPPPAQVGALLLLLACVGFVLVAPAHAQIVRIDYATGSFGWTWAIGTGGDATGFRLKCGLLSGTYTITSATLAPDARTANVRDIVPTIDTYYCIVVAFNDGGESDPSNEVAFTGGVRRHIGIGGIWVR